MTSPPPARGRSERWLDAAPWLALFAFAAALTLQRIRSHDYWWHLATGRYIVENGGIPTADPFSFSAYQAAWHYSHWLFQVLTFGLHEIAGHAGVVVAKLVPVFAVVALLARIGYRRTRPLVTLAALAAMLVFTDQHTTLSFTRFDSPGIELGDVGWSIWAVLLVLGATNAVNLTDGLDGLAAGSAALTFMAFTTIGFWSFRHPEVYATAHALDLAVVAAAMLGACTGFLWWNAAPARIFMGDTGSLAIGAGLAALALALNTQLLLPVLAGLFVMETLSVILQVGTFRLANRRVLRMAPIHHHFELGGWPETTVIVRFWILAALCTAVGLGLYYADFIGTGAID